MRDLWTCACTAHLLEHRLPRSTVVRAIPNVLQSGSSYLQLHGNDLEVNSLMVDPEEPHTVAFHRNWKRVWCVRCGTALGQAEMPNADTIGDHQQHSSIESNHHHHLEAEPSSNEISPFHSSHEEPDSEHDVDKSINQILFRNVKLDKHMLKTDKNIFGNHRLETKVSADILSIISITGCFNILLRDYRTREPILLLAILGWDSLIFCSTAPSQPGRSPYLTPMPAIRLTFHTIQEGESISSMGLLEMLELDNFSILEITTLLTLRNSLLPSSISKLGSKSISYLHYIPPEP
jgi:hypothetical protein